LLAASSPLAAQTSIPRRGGAVGGTYASTGGAGGTSTSPTGIGSLIAGGGSAASADGTRDRAVRGTVPSWTRTAGPRPMTAAPSVVRRTGPRWRWAKKSGPPRARWSISLARRRWNRSPRFPHNNKLLFHEGPPRNIRSGRCTSPLAPRWHPRSRLTGLRRVGVVQFDNGYLLFKLQCYGRQSLHSQRVKRQNDQPTRLRQPPIEFLFVAIVRHPTSPSRRLGTAEETFWFYAGLVFCLSTATLRGVRVRRRDPGEPLRSLRGHFVGSGRDDFEVLEMSVRSKKPAKWSDDSHIARIRTQEK